MGTSLSRQIKESPLYIGKNETTPYVLRFTGSLPEEITSLSSPVCTLHDVTHAPEGSDGVDVSSTKLVGSPTFSGLVMTLPLITGLIRDHKYILRCRGSGGGSTFERWAEVYGEL